MSATIALSLAHFFGSKVVMSTVWEVRQHSTHGRALQTEQLQIQKERLMDISRQGSEFRVVWGAGVPQHNEKAIVDKLRATHKYFPPPF